MITRNFWLEKLNDLWKRRSIIWMSGVRRVGKTSLCQQLGDSIYYNCDLPSVQRNLSDPEFFLEQQNRQKTIILDEIHRLKDPCLLLKIAADSYPKLKILATGSSTLEATRKFRDTLTGRKYSLSLPPVLWSECLGSFNTQDFDRRLICGGLPERLLSGDSDPDFYEEWIDSFYARDVAELFGVRNRTGFLGLFKLICLRSGGQLDIGDLAKEAGISRPSVMSYLDALEISNAIFRIPPFFGGGHREIVRRPKIYAFDSGFIAHVRGWESIRETDRGHLWENLVLDELRSVFPLSSIHYWRDKSQREVDFIVEKPGGHLDAIEAKINPESFSSESLKVFRKQYPKGCNILVCPFVKKTCLIRKESLEINVCSTSDLVSCVTNTLNKIQNPKGHGI